MALILSLYRWHNNFYFLQKYKRKWKMGRKWKKKINIIPAGLELIFCASCTKEEDKKHEKNKKDTAGLELIISWALPTPAGMVTVPACITQKQRPSNNIFLILK